MTTMVATFPHQSKARALAALLKESWEKQDRITRAMVFSSLMFVMAAVFLALAQSASADTCAGVDPAIKAAMSMEALLPVRAL